MSESDLREQIRTLCKVYGWRMAFTQYSLRSPKGFPDLVLVKPPRLIFAELKRDSGKTTPEQDAWLADLQKVAVACMEFEHEHTEVGVETFVKRAPIEVRVWRPSDIDEIVRVLSRVEGSKGERSEAVP